MLCSCCARAVPAPQLLPSVARRVRDPAGVALEIQALEAAALSKLSRGSTRVVVMDERVSGRGAGPSAGHLRAAVGAGACWQAGRERRQVQAAEARRADLR